MGSTASQLTDEVLDAVDEYMRGVVKGSERPVALPAHWLTRRWPDIRRQSWLGWLRIGRRLIEAEEVGQLGPAERAQGVSGEHSRRCRALAHMCAQIEIGSAGRYIERLQDMAEEVEELDPRVRLKATELLLRRIEPGHWDGRGGAHEPEPAHETPASARVRALSRERIENLSDAERARVAEILAAERAAADEAKEREAELQRLLEGE